MSEKVKQTIINEGLNIKPSQSSLTMVQDGLNIKPNQTKNSSVPTKSDTPPKGSEQK